MTWSYWIALYTTTHCTARGLRSATIVAYRATLDQFREWIREHQQNIDPRQVTARQVLEYLEHLRRDRDNGASAVNRQVTILKNFYRAMVAMGQLEPRENPLTHFPKIKAAARKLPVVLSSEEVERLLAHPPDDTVLGLRDRAMLTLLYGTGIRASECATLREEDVDLEELTVTVAGKGGHQRTVPMNERVADALRLYRRHRGPVAPESSFFRSRAGAPLGRGAIYDRVRTHARQARIHKRVSPHKLRHTFATHLVKAGVGLVTIRDLLGHRSITSTQIYLHVTAQDLREAADRHPIRHLTPIVDHLLADLKLPMQRARPFRRTG